MDENNTQQPAGSGASWQFRPGDAVSPGQIQPVASAAAQPMPQSPVAAATQPQQPVIPQDAAGSFSTQPMLHPDAYVPGWSQLPTSRDGDVVSWTASEFIAHQKSPSWYALLVLITAVVAAAIFFLTKDKVSTTVVVLAAIVFGVYASHKPKTVGYKVDDAGLSIGQKFYDYGQFRSFAIMDEGAFSSIVFMPLQRFLPLITVYYDPKDEQRIVDTLSDQLPLDTHKLGLLDQFMRRIRF